MRLFGRKKNKQPKDVAAGAGGGKTTPAAPAPPPPESPLTVVRYVGETKHVTTTTVDELGRTVQQTRVFKLTADEMEELGIRPSRAAAALSESESLEYTQDYSVAASEPYLMSDVFSASLPSQQHPPVPASAPAPAPPASSSNNCTGTGMMSTPTAALDGDDEPNGGPSPAAIEVTRELVKKFISDIWNRGEVELIPVVCHPSLRFNGHVGMDRVGHNGFEMMVISVREALTDYHCEIHSMVVESNKAFCRLRFTGKHTGNLLGYPATGRGVAWMGASEFTCKNGKILKVWELGDLKSLEEQLKGNPVE